MPPLTLYGYNSCVDRHAISAGLIPLLWPLVIIRATLETTKRLPTWLTGSRRRLWLAGRSPRRRNPPPAGGAQRRAGRGGKARPHPLAAPRVPKPHRRLSLPGHARPHRHGNHQAEKSRKTLLAEQAQAVRTALASRAKPATAAGRGKGAKRQKVFLRLGNGPRGRVASNTRFPRPRTFSDYSPAPRQI
jgi:hypothetical protein